MTEYNNPVQRIRVNRLAQAYGKNNIPFPPDEYDRFYHCPGELLDHLTEYWEKRARGEEPDQRVPACGQVYFHKRNTNIDRTVASDYRYHGFTG